MNKASWTTVLGLASVIALNLAPSVQAEPRVYLETGGRESIELNPDTLAILEDIGLTLTETISTTTPAPGFSIGAALVPPSSVPGVRGTTFTFLYDEDPLLYVPLGGTEEFSGSFIFDVDTDKLSGLGTEFTIGNFSNGFDENFSFSITDTLTTNLPLLDVSSSGIPDVDLDSQTWVLEGLEFFISEEFNSLLENAGATQSVAGLKFADARGNRSFVEVTEEVTVPEPRNGVALFLLVICAIAFKKSTKLSKKIVRV
ncbi:MAG: PEP-CTERM sorting domain-containing protein [Xenococcaceae cyanobacterium]